MIPKPRKGLQLPSSYRPISSLSNLSKIGESITLDKLRDDVGEPLLPDVETTVWSVGWFASRLIGRLTAAYGGGTQCSGVATFDRSGFSRLCSCL